MPPVWGCSWTSCMARSRERATLRDPLAESRTGASLPPGLRHIRLPECRAGAFVYPPACATSVCRVPTPGGPRCRRDMLALSMATGSLLSRRATECEHLPSVQVVGDVPAFMARDGLCTLLELRRVLAPSQSALRLNWLQAYCTCSFSCGVWSSHQARGCGVADGEVRSCGACDAKCCRLHTGRNAAHL